MATTTSTVVVVLPECVARIAETFKFTREVAESMWTATLPLQTQDTLTGCARVPLIDYCACFASYLKTHNMVDGVGYYQYLCAWIERAPTLMWQQRQASTSIVTEIKHEIDANLAPIKQLQQDMASKPSSSSSSSSKKAAVKPVLFCKVCRSGEFVSFNFQQTSGADESWTTKYECTNAQSHPDRQNHCWNEK